MPLRKIKSDKVLHILSNGQKRDARYYTSVINTQGTVNYLSMQGSLGAPYRACFIYHKGIQEGTFAAFHSSCCFYHSYLKKKKKSFLLFVLFPVFNSIYRPIMFLLHCTTPCNSGFERHFINKVYDVIINIYYY